MAKITATSGKGIIGNASQLELNYTTSITQVKSQSGIRKAQRRGPLLYNLTVELPPCRLNGDIYYQVMEEIMLLNYGANTLEFKLDNQTAAGFAITSERGVWTGNPVVDTIDQTGQNLTITAAGQATVANYARAFDFVQFQGSTKVYQVAAKIIATTVYDTYVTDGSGSIEIDGSNTGLNLNTPLVVSPNTSATVVFGRDVLFNMQLVKRPTITYLPGNVVEFGEFKFEEILE